MSSSMSWNGSWLALSEKWMDSRRVYDILKSTDGCLMASRSCDHSFERSWDEYLEYGEKNGVGQNSLYSRYRFVGLHIYVSACLNFSVYSFLYVCFVSMFKVLIRVRVGVVLCALCLIHACVCV